MAKDVIAWLLISVMNAVTSPRSITTSITSSNAPTSTSARANTSATFSSTSRSITITPTTATTKAPSTSTPMTLRRMASKASEIFTSSEWMKIKLAKICTEICRRMLFEVFLWGTKKDESIPLDQYLLQEKGWRDQQIRKRFSKTELERFKADPKGETYDVTLLLRILPWACENLAPADSPKWVTPSVGFEYCLNEVKCFRNDLMHDSFTFHSSDFPDMVERIRDLLTKMMEAAGDFYCVEKSTVKKTVRDMNHHIDRIRDCTLMPQHLESYRADLLFEDLVNLMKLSGKKELKEHYTRNRTTCVNPTSFIVDSNLNCKVEQVFTPLRLKDGSRGGRGKDLEYENLLLLSNSQPQVTLVEGIAGAGKTTITQHLISQWCCSSPAIKDLDTYDLLILMECRNSSISSFFELLVSLMPKSRQQFRDSDLLPVFKRQKSLILVDGLDEYNKTSWTLLKDILYLKKNDENAQILVFSRPERLEDFFRMVQDKGYKVNHIKVGEIPSQKRESFIRKYHKELKLQGQCDGDVEELLKYLRTTGIYLSHLWGLPLHLVMLLGLWVADHTRIKKIRTPTGLHMEFLTLSIEKLCQRLVGKVPFSDDELKRKIRIFLFTLSKIALEALRDDVLIVLTHNHVSDLRQVCDRLSLPFYDVTGSFLVLKKTWCATDVFTSLRFTHKSQQDFEASLFLNHVILGGSRGEPKEEKRREIENALMKIGYSFNELQGFIVCPPEDHELIFPLPQDNTASAAISFQTLTRSLQTSVPLASPATDPRTPFCTLKLLKDIFQRKQNEIQRMGKFQSTLVHLLRLMHMRGHIPPDTAGEVVQLLKEARFGCKMFKDYGLTKWLELLSEVDQDTLAKALADLLHDYDFETENDSDTDYECAIQVGNIVGATLFFKHFQPNVISFNEMLSKGDAYDNLAEILMNSKCRVTITNLYEPYLRIMEISGFLPNEVKEIWIYDPTRPKWENVLREWAEKQMKLQSFFVNPESSAPDNFAHLVPQVLLKCRIRMYWGRARYIGMDEIPTVKNAYLWIQDESDTLDHLNRTLPNLKALDITVMKGMDPSLLTSPPMTISHLIFCHLTDTDIEWATKVAKALLTAHSAKGVEIVIDTVSGDTFLSLEGLQCFSNLLRDAGIHMKKMSVGHKIYQHLEDEERKKLKERIEGILHYSVSLE